MYQNHLEDLLNHIHWVPLTEFVIQSVCSVAWESVCHQALPTSFQNQESKDSALKSIVHLACEEELQADN